MDSRNLPYGRGSVNLPVRTTDDSPGEKKPVRELSGHPLIVQEHTLSAAYSRGKGVLSARQFFVISGGTERERSYLLALGKKSEFRNLKVVFISSEKGKGGLTPAMMVAEAEKILKHKRIIIDEIQYRLHKYDVVYLVSDVDHYMKQLKIMVPQTRGCRWIISNPAFEIWLYYSYFNDPTKDLADVFQAKASQRSRKLKELNSVLQPGGIDPRKAFERMPDAIRNSMSHYEEDSYGIPKLLSTQMHLLAQDILRELGEEFREWLAGKEEQNKKFKNELSSSGK